MENQYQIVSASSPSELSSKIGKLISEGWTRQGSHMVVLVNEQLRYSGEDHTSSYYEREYSQTMVKESIEEVSEVLKPRDFRTLGSYADRELFGTKPQLKVGLLYRFSYDFNGPEIGIGRYVAKTDTLYYICLEEGGGVGMETPSKLKNFQIIEIICAIPK